jgi:hypothetical protein
MSRRKSLRALVAVTAALAVAVPAAGASATAARPAARTVHIGVSGGLQPGSLPCRILVRQIQAALALGHPVWANVLSTVFIYAGCGGAAT